MYVTYKTENGRKFLSKENGKVVFHDDATLFDNEITYLVLTFASDLHTFCKENGLDMEFVSYYQGGMVDTTATLSDDFLYEMKKEIDKIIG